ncbi:hypothetical protein Dret_2551 (plasmid) [Desulfohalobium retbaense DSM 5692]|uniref:Uncharacterized protein n=1 Tax=Desulfohalobium retbaense (strain ATCC 49708 / DSM 5692 / JCM 16813 / HR100) TaxID=485915 RepID=C8X5Y0_DESRD|nr:hypothetical protein Dret_2551 [Desulfohalobium retbaense DSM 5692]
MRFSVPAGDRSVLSSFCKHDQAVFSGEPGGIWALQGFLWGMVALRPCREFGQCLCPFLRLVVQQPHLCIHIVKYPWPLPISRSENPTHDLEQPSFEANRRSQKLTGRPEQSNPSPKSWMVEHNTGTFPTWIAFTIRSRPSLGVFPVTTLGLLFCVPHKPRPGLTMDHPVIDHQGGPGLKKLKAKK